LVSINKYITVTVFRSLQQEVEFKEVLLFDEFSGETAPPKKKLVGAFGNGSPATEETQAIADAVKANAEKDAGKTFA